MQKRGHLRRSERCREGGEIAEGCIDGEQPAVEGGNPGGVEQHPVGIRAAVGPSLRLSLPVPAGCFPPRPIRATAASTAILGKDDSFIPR